MIVFFVRQEERMEKCCSDKISRDSDNKSGYSDILVGKGYSGMYF